MGIEAGLALGVVSLLPLILFPAVLVGATGVAIPMFDAGEMLEWAEVFGEFYGTPSGPTTSSCLARTWNSWS